MSPRPRHPAWLARDYPALGWWGWGAAACIKGVPGSFCAPRPHSPANFLEEEGNRGLVAAVFGILFSSLCILVLDRDPLPLVPNSSQHSRGKASSTGEPPGGLFTLVPTESTRHLCSLGSIEYWKILALLYYPAFYCPLAACATVRHRAGYLVGCLLSWCHCVVHIWQKVDCPQSPKVCAPPRGRLLGPEVAVLAPRRGGTEVSPGRCVTAPLVPRYTGTTPRSPTSPSSSASWS